ncbi:metallopeptidase family protein [Corynebacterium sp. 320]|uniref:Metallopeptidase family protein n=1 Tax=Corynebacterium zhongnanshanii TaxID=2768834 RepID=A0ABQ6VEP3_9CORY|nr:MULTISPECIES: metallopeptidase family protein [Corynebacterium]KAB1504347.1 metallopeptidase family protein [Corynebacterium sp. 320]KAB1552553.1 metallopeptidase family protein [Corynebacterium sp. 321]KAB1554229.1 metallopeptidase family protein [Corynebacterium sp. 319]KAB3522793.1 metallopeptidase family protein [Corynebacterium zhongnanshanii]KAB3528483.1 metallopeptidase family protein [Corynebacterium sp. 250]
MAVEVSDERFEELVDEGLRRIPRELLDNVRNVAIVIEDFNWESPSILGLYEGIALTERTSEYTSALPDKITIYQDSLCDFCESEEELVEQVAITVIHELGHHFGISDERLHELGWG